MKFFSRLVFVNNDARLSSLPSLWGKGCKWSKMSFYLGKCISFHAPPDWVFRRYQTSEFRLPMVLFALAIYGPVYMEFCIMFDWILNAPGTGLAASALDRFVCTVHGSQFSEDGRCGLPCRVNKRSHAPVQKLCCTVLEVG